MNIHIDKEDLKEIEDRLPALSQWLNSHFTSFQAECIIIQSILDTVEKIKGEIE